MPVVVLKGLFNLDESESWIREVEAFRILGERSTIHRFQCEGREFDSLLLGHRGLSLPQGPLTVAALGWDPPERSTHFHLSLLGLKDDQVSFAQVPPNEQEFEQIAHALARLDSRSMTTLLGEGPDHALVWERRVDLLTRNPEFASENGFRHSLPEGDQENEIRRYIDDSVNILSDLEINRRRGDMGLQPVNLAWPWGQGERTPVDNRAIRLGYPWSIFTDSLALRGYARLSGFRPQKIRAYSGLGKSELQSILKSLQADPHSIFATSIGMVNDPEEAIAKAEEFGRILVLPLIEHYRHASEPVVVIGVNQNESGLCAICTEKPTDWDPFPFDERSIQEPRVLDRDLDRLLESVS